MLRSIRWLGNSIHSSPFFLKGVDTTRAPSSSFHLPLDTRSTPHKYQVYLRICSVQPLSKKHEIPIVYPFYCWSSQDSWCLKSPSNTMFHGKVTSFHRVKSPFLHSFQLPGTSGTSETPGNCLFQQFVGARQRLSTCSFLGFHQKLGIYSWWNNWDP